jgi:hypothetical protein
VRGPAVAPVLFFLEVAYLSPLRGKKERASKSVLMNNDRGRTHAFALHKAEQDRGVAGIKPDAAVRGRAAEMRNLIMRYRNR